MKSVDNPPRLAWALLLAAIEVNLSTGNLLKLTTGAAAGSTLIHSAACVWSDICDVEFDKKVGT